MSLYDYERRFVDYLFGRAPEAEGLGDPMRLALYRGMAERRVLGQARTAYPASHAQLGEARFAGALACYLRDAPPTSHALRDALVGFADHAAQQLAGGPDFLPELLALEAQLFHCAFVEAPEPAPVAELDFAAPPLFLTPLSVFRARYPVHRLLSCEPHAELGPEACVLWVYRDPADVARWRVTSELLAGISERAGVHPRASLTELVQASAAAAQRPVDHALLSELSDGLTAALAAGVLRGSRGAA